MKHLTVHAVTQEKRKYLPIKILILFLCNFVAFVTIVTIRATRNDLLLSNLPREGLVQFCLTICKSYTGLLVCTNPAVNNRTSL